MKRLASAPLFVQALALVALTTVAAQLITLVALLVMNLSRPWVTFDDVLAAVEHAPAGRDEEPLDLEFVGSPPPDWARDDLYERRLRAALAARLGRPPADVLVERELPLPGLGWAVRVLYPEAPPDAPAPPLQWGPRTLFEELAVAVRLAEDSWLVARPPDPLLGHVGHFILVWLLASAIVLVPLAWRFTRRLVAPISAFADAAERAGRGDRDAVFPETGPKETRIAGRALAEMQRRIAGAVEERTRLIAAVAHDLRTPLTRLRFRAEYAPPEHRERIIRDIERMDAMIAGVLAFARGEERLDRQRLDLAALVQSMVDDLVDTGADATLAEAAPVEVLGDPLALRRLVANLLDNAITYGGRARCQVCRQGDDALLLIDDAGPGIAEDALERMFSPFERGDAARDPATGGVGLGLALARGIARAHGGDVRLERLPACGLRAHVRLPAAAERPS